MKTTVVAKHRSQGIFVLTSGAHLRLLDDFVAAAVAKFGTRNNVRRTVGAQVHAAKINTLFLIKKLFVSNFQPHQKKVFAGTPLGAQRLLNQVVKIQKNEPCVAPPVLLLGPFFIHFHTHF
jgi:hypothetical protein